MKCKDSERQREDRDIRGKKESRTTGQVEGIDGWMSSFPSHMRTGEWVLFLQPPPPSAGDTPFEAKLFINRQMQLFMKLIIEEK